MTPLPLPKDPRHQRFADLLLAGIPAPDAYKQAGFKSTTRQAAIAAAARLRNKPAVAAYIAACQARQAAKAEISREDVVGFLARVIRTPVGEIEPGNDLCQEFSEDPATGSRKVKMPNKLGAAKQLADILGWNKPQEVQVSASDQLADILARIRRA